MEKLKKPPTMWKNREKHQIMSKNDQNFKKTWKKPSKISKKRQKCRKTAKKP